MVHVMIAAAVVALILGVSMAGMLLDRAGAARLRRQAAEALKAWGVEARSRQETCRCPDAHCVGSVCVRFADGGDTRWHCARCGSPCDGTAGDFYGALRKRMGASESWYRRPEELAAVHEALRALET